MEVTGGTTTSTKQFVWCGDERCEVRDATGALVNQYFSRGQINVSGGVGTSYFYTLDHLGSVREMTDSSANVADQLTYDPYGRASQLQGSIAPDFQYAGCLIHSRSELNLAGARVYNSAFGRWLSRDPIGDAGGLNLYGYVGNSPAMFTDPSGLCDNYQSKQKQPPDDDDPAVGGTSVPTHYLWQPTPTLRGHLELSQIDVFYVGAGRGSNVFDEIYTAPLHDQATPDPAVDLFIASVATSIGRTLIAGPGKLVAGAFGWQSMGSTGRTLPKNMAEEILGRMAAESPKLGMELPFKMTDPRWPWWLGWVKMQMTAPRAGRGVAGVVHYVYNKWTGVVDDIKFK